MHKCTIIAEKLQYFQNVKKGQNKVDAIEFCIT